jgi:hypothetical protein
MADCESVGPPAARQEPSLVDAADAQGPCASAPGTLACGGLGLPTAAHHLAVVFRRPIQRGTTARRAANCRSAAAALATRSSALRPLQGCEHHRGVGLRSSASDRIGRCTTTSESAPWQSTVQATYRAERAETQAPQLTVGVLH